MSSSSSSKFESPEGSQRSREESGDQVLETLQSVRNIIASLALDNQISTTQDNAHFEECYSQYLEKTPKANHSPKSKSAEDLASSHGQVPLNLLAATSRKSWISHLPTFSREPSPPRKHTAEVKRRKTRDAVKRGLTSPLGKHQQGLPSKPKTPAADTSQDSSTMPLSVHEDEDGHQENLENGENDSQHEPGEEISQTPLWDALLLREDSFKRTVGKDLESIQVKLADRETTHNEAEDMLIDIEDLEGELNGLEVELKLLQTTEPIEEGVAMRVVDGFRNSRRNIKKAKSKVHKAIGTSDVQTLGSSKSSTDADTTVAAVRNAAHAPKVTFPKFRGEIAKYSAFKTNFQYIITLTNCPEGLWGTHLYNALEGEALECVGNQDNWNDKYDELWEALDDRFANRWVLANDTIAALFGKAPPDSAPDDIKAYFYSQCAALKTVVNLNMTVEEVGVSFIWQSLPEEVGDNLRQGLKLLRPNKNQYAFTIKEIMHVFNDITRTKGAARVADTSRGTLSLKAAVQAHPPSGGHPPTGGHPPSWGQHSSSGEQRYSRGAGRRGRGAPRGRGGFRRPPKPRRCRLCPTEGHTPYFCPTYNTPELRRERLKELGLCIACAGTEHRGACPKDVICTFHTDANHIFYTCGGGDHPGKQEPEYR